MTVLTAISLSEDSGEPPETERARPDGEARAPYPVGTFVWGVRSTGEKFEGVVRRVVGPHGLRVEIHDKITVRDTEIRGSVESSPQLVTVLQTMWEHEERHRRAMAAARRRAAPRRRR